MSKILIVDDHLMLLESMQMAFEDEYSVDTVESGELALEKVDRQKPDLMIIDYFMKPMTGLELICRMRQMIDPPKMILYSGCLSNALIDQALQVGAAACVHKPFDLHQMKQLIRDVLGLK